MINFGQKLNFNTKNYKCFGLKLYKVFMFILLYSMENYKKQSQCAASAAQAIPGDIGRPGRRLPRRSRGPARLPSWWFQLALDPNGSRSRRRVRHGRWYRKPRHQAATNILPSRVWMILVDRQSRAFYSHKQGTNIWP